MKSLIYDWICEHLKTRDIGEWIHSDESILAAFLEAFPSSSANEPHHMFEAVVQEEENRLIEQLSYYCYLMMYVMDTSQTWGDAGEHQVKSSFCRNILQLPHDAPISEENWELFSHTLQDKYRHHHIQELPLSKAKDALNSYKINWFRDSYSFQDFQTISVQLRLLGSSLYLQGGYYGTDVEFILGKGQRRVFDDFLVIEMETELIRTPNTIVAMAAIIGDKEIIIRRESLSTIYHYKWANFQPETSDFSRYYSNEEPDPYTLSEAIKLSTVSSYEALSTGSFQDHSQRFIDDMTETILWHEVGHAIIQYHTLPFPSGSLAEATKVWGENVFTACLEFLADFAPKFGALKGPIQNMIDISKHDLPRARCMFFMYMSDTWFFDTQDSYMYTYSEMLGMCMGSALKPGTVPSINFERLEVIVGQSIKDSTSLVSWVANEIQTMGQYLQDMFSGHLYDFSKLGEVIQRGTESIPEDSQKTIQSWTETNCLSRVSFEQLDALVFKEIKLNDSKQETDQSYKFITAYWTKIFEYALYDSHIKTKLDHYFFQAEKTLMATWNHHIETLSKDLPLSPNRDDSCSPDIGKSSLTDIGEPSSIRSYVYSLYTPLLGDGI